MRWFGQNGPMYRIIGKIKMKEEALKLADEIESFGKEADIQTSKTHGDYHRKVSAMIRRLVEELEELKHDNEELLKCLTAERKQGEPVAWMKIVTDEDGQFRVYEDEEPEWDDSCIPLYATPKTKPLSVDEIYEICAMFEESIWDVSAIDFARAIEERHGIK